MYKGEKKMMFILCPASFALFVTGASFGYFVVVPIAVKFLLSFASDYITPAITINNYISFIATFTLSFGLIFELPLALLFLAKMGIVTPYLLSNKRRHAIVIIFIVAAILTPPDVASQILLALPLLFLYELSILLMKIFYKKEKLVS
jgi:sec-independent protein translocase protein TatC